MARSSDDSAEYVRDLSQAHGVTGHWGFETDSILGLQANVGIRPELEAVVQVVSQHGSEGNFNPELTWAFLRFEPTPTWSLRAGRLGTELYMLADSRMVGYSYVTVRPPADYYGTLPFDFIDGMDIGFARQVSRGLVKAKLFAGLSREQAPWADVQFNMSGTLLVGGYLDFLTGSWQFRISQVGVKFEHDLPVESFYQALPAPAADELRIAGKWSGFTSLGLIYDSGPLQTHMMASKTVNDHAAFQDTWAGYLIMSYGIGDLRPFIGLSIAKSKSKDLRYPAPGYTDAYLAQFVSDQHTSFLGARWDFMESVSLKAQVDIIRGDADSRFLYRWETPEWDGSMTVFSLALDFVF